MTESKTLQLHNLLQSSQLDFALEAHNGLSAKIVENAGFKAIWASGFAIASSLALRDVNEVSFTQLCNIVENMSAVTSIPVFVDGDSGFGNFNNVRLLVRALSRAGAAGVCIEDKVFPKNNSLLGNVRANQELISIDEFCGKIKAAKDNTLDDNFIVSGRVEGLIAGESISDTLIRAEAYHAAGADAILVHSNQSTAYEIIEFATEWQNRCPLIIVPTNYYKTPTADFRKCHISMILWANHNFRACINIMEKISNIIYQTQSVNNIQEKLCSVQHVFELLDYNELEEAEKKYFE